MHGICDKCGEKLMKKVGDEAKLIKKVFKQYKDFENELTRIFKDTAIIYNIDASGISQETAKTILGLL